MNSSTTKKTPVTTGDRKKQISRLHTRAADLLLRATASAKRYGQPPRKRTP